MARPSISNADEWLLWLEEHKDSEPGFVAVQIVEAIEEHQRALARQVYALAEATQDECHGKDDAYHRGRYHEAKGIARAINAIMPLSRDPAALSEATP